MSYAEILTPWTGDGSRADPYRPLVFYDYTLRLMDATNANPPYQPNVNVTYCEGEDAELDAVAADARFYILYRDGTETGVPPTNEFGQLRGYLAQQGMDQEDIDAAVGTSANGRTRAEINEDIKTYLRSL